MKQHGLIERLTPSRVRAGGMSLALILLGGSAVLLVSSWDERESTIARLSKELDVVVEEHARVSTRRSGLIERVRELEGTVGEVEQGPRPSTPNEVAAELMRHAERSLLVSPRVDPKGQKDSGPYSFEISVTGTYEAIKRWSLKVNDTMRDIHVVWLSLTPDSADRHELRARFRLDWYKPQNPNEDTQES